MPLPRYLSSVKQSTLKSHVVRKVSLEKERWEAKGSNVFSIGKRKFYSLRREPKCARKGAWILGRGLELGSMVVGLGLQRNTANENEQRGCWVDFSE